MANIVNNYRGEITLPDGKVVKFNISGTSKIEVNKLLKKAQPNARIKFKK
jgi:hypothetical protein